MTPAQNDSLMDIYFRLNTIWLELNKLAKEFELNKEPVRAQEMRDGMAYAEAAQHAIYIASEGTIKGFFERRRAT